MITALLGFLLYGAIVALIFWLLLWLVNSYAPEPLRTVFRVVIIIVLVIIIVYMLLGLLPSLPGPLFPSPRR
jgi:hypothetical protein